MIKPIRGIPIQKSSETIKFYINEGQKFGQILYDIYKLIKEQKLIDGQQVQNYFENECQKQWSHSQFVNFPFNYQITPYNSERFNHSICVSINDCIAHGKQHNQKFNKKDVVSLDFGLCLPNKDRVYNFDAAFTVEISTKQTNDDWTNLPYKALRKILDFQPSRINQISEIIYNYRKLSKQNVYKVICAFSGHGIGQDLHEPPAIPNKPTGSSKENNNLFEGMCFCVEPMYSKCIATIEDSVESIYLDESGWSAFTNSKTSATHWETMFCIYQDQVIDLVGITNWKLTEKG